MSHTLPLLELSISRQPPDYQNLLFGLPNTLRKKYPCKSVFQAAYKNNNFLPHYQYVHYITGSIFEQYL